MAFVILLTMFALGPVRVIIRMMVVIAAFRLAEVRVNGGIEMPAEPVDPIVRFARISEVLVLVAGAGAGSHVQFIIIRAPIENRRVIAAMKVGVCFYIEVFGKKPAAITQSYRKEIGGVRAAANPRLEPWLQPGHQAHGQSHEQQCKEGWSPPAHSD
jgi:hypothetical protein